jgi:hypothetical protein
MPRTPFLGLLAPLALPALLALFATLSEEPLLAQEAKETKDVKKDVKKDEELHFVHQLRARGSADLALEYLEKRLSKDPRYAGKPELALEIALARLDRAAIHPDAAQRLTLFGQARAELEAFLKNHANHPRAAAARVEIANVVTFQGKTQLARALAMQEGDPAREDELAKARKLLSDAKKELTATANSLPTDVEKSRAKVELGLLALDVVRTYTNEDDKGRDQALKDAITALEEVTAKLENTDPARLRALAWLGRARSLNGEPKEASKALNEASASKDPTARRLATYFDLLADFEKQQSLRANPALVDINALIKKASDWQKAHAAFKNTPEGYGVLYVLAREYFLRGAALTAANDRNAAWNTARTYIRELEGVENEFTTSAQELKIDILIKENAFTRAENTLISFDDNYMRALYEHKQLIKEAKKFEDAKGKKEQQQKIVRLLKKAIDQAKAAKFRGIPETDLGTAYYMLTGYEAELDNLETAAKYAEEFAVAHPRAKQAPAAALFAADTREKMIRKVAGDDFEQLKPEREALYKFARFMVERWPGDKPGSYGRYIIVNYLVKKPLTSKDPAERAREKKARQDEALRIGGDVARLDIALDRAKERRFLETIQLISPIKPGFSSYPLAQYQLALAALQLDGDYTRLEKAERRDPKDEEYFKDLKASLAAQGQKSYKDLAMASLEKVPTPVDPARDPLSNLIYVRSKIELGKLLYGINKYDQMEQMTKQLLALLPNLKFDKSVEEEAKSFPQQVESLHLYSLYGRAFADYKANRFVEVAARLDPLVNDIGAGKYVELKDNQRLLTSLLGLALRSNLQTERLSRAMEVLRVWKSVDKEDKEAIAKILRQTVAVMKKQVEELQKKKDKVNLAKTVTGFNAFLNAVVKEEKVLAPDFRLLLAQSYASVGEHGKALEMLEKLLKELTKNPKADAKGDAKGDPASTDPKLVSINRIAQVMQVRALRLKGKEDKDEKLIKQAETLIDEIIESKGKPNWGRRDVNALIEQLYVYLDRTYYGAAVNRANALLKILLPKLPQGGALKDRYFETYYLFVLGYYKYGLSRTKPAERQENIAKAAGHLYQLITKHPEMGGEDSRQRFTELLESPEGAELKKAYEQIKNKK